MTFLQRSGFLDPNVSFCYRAARQFLPWLTPAVLQNIIRCFRAGTSILHRASGHAQLENRRRTFVPECALTSGNAEEAREAREGGEVVCGGSKPGQQNACEQRPELPGSCAWDIGGD